MSVKDIQESITGFEKLLKHHIVFLLISVLLYYDLMFTLFINKNLLNIDVSVDLIENMGLILILFCIYLFCSIILMPPLWSILFKTKLGELAFHLAIRNNKNISHSNLVNLDKLQTYALKENNSVLMEYFKDHHGRAQNLMSAKLSELFIGLLFIINIFIPESSIPYILSNNFQNIPYYIIIILLLVLGSVFIFFSVYINELGYIFIGDQELTSKIKLNS